MMRCIKKNISVEVDLDESGNITIEDFDITNFAGITKDASCGSEHKSFVAVVIRKFFEKELKTKKELRK